MIWSYSCRILVLRCKITFFFLIKNIRLLINNRFSRLYLSLPDTYCFVFLQINIYCRISMLETKNNPFYYIIIIIICFFSFFINNNVVPADYMESRNLATAQEMVQYGNYLMPTMNGELRLEKPPLPTWIAAAVEHISPDNLVAQRCMSGLSATLMVLFLFLLASRLTKNYGIGFIAALGLCRAVSVYRKGAALHRFGYDNGTGHRLVAVTK